jgi:rhomboid protease GluP
MVTLGDRDPPAGGSLGDRMLAALLAVADQRSITALVGINDPPLAVVVLPDLGAGVVLVTRIAEDDDPAALKQRLAAILRGHANGILHLVLAGARPQDREALLAADREAPDPNRLGVHVLDQAGQVTRVAGRHLGLLKAAAARLGQVRPLSDEQLAEHNARSKAGRQDAAAFAAALDHRPQWAIRLLGTACIAMFGLAVLWGHRSFGMALEHMGANSLAAVKAGEVWRLIAHAFLHGNSTHLIVNLIGLFSFGGFLEGLLGWRRIVILYGLAALAGGLASAFIGRVELSVGASGALWGLMTAGIGIVLRREPIVPPLVAGRLRPRLLSVLALNVAFSLAPLFLAGFPRIDLWAHAGGGLVGFALAGTGWLARGLLPGQPPSAPAANPPGLRIGAIVTIALLVLSVALALLTGRPWEPQVVPEVDQFT